MGKVWKEGSPLQEAIRPDSVTLVVGGPGSGKTEATSVLASMARAGGGAIHIINRGRIPTGADKINERLSQSVREAGKGDLVIVREVFESDNVNFLEIGLLARKRNVTVVLEMQTVDLGAARDVGCDVLVMQLMPYDRHVQSLSDLTRKDIAQINSLRTGEGILLSQGQKPESVRVEMLRSEFAV